MKALKRVVFWQSAVWLGCTLLAFILSGKGAAISAFLSGAVCALPSFFVISLLIVFKDAPASPVGIFILEFLKVSLSILGFLCVALFFKDLDWLAFILTVIAVLISHVFALASRR